MIVSKKDLMALDQNRWEAAKKMAQMVSQVPGFAYYKKPHEAFLITIKAHDMNLSFTEALEQMFVVNGRTAIQGSLMLSRIRSQGHTVTIKQVSSTMAKVECQRKDEKTPTTWTYTIEEAKAAGLLHKDNWKKYPADMLLWRVVARAARFQFSECLGGSGHLPDEIGIDEERDVSSFRVEDNKSDVTDIFMNTLDKQGPCDQTNGAPGSSSEAKEEGRPE